MIEENLAKVRLYKKGCDMMEEKIYDVLVVGAGPAGLSAAINVRQRNGSVMVIGLPLAGNPLYKAADVDNYPGLPKISGADLLQAMYDHALQKGVEFSEERLLNAFPMGETWMVSAGTNVFTGRRLIFTGGVTRGKTFPGENEFLGRGVSYCTTCDGMLYKGKTVVVIGFSDTDQKEVDYLKGITPQVTYFQRPKSAVIEGTKLVERVVIDGTAHQADGVFILRPALSPASLFPNITLENGFIQVDKGMHTNIPGLFAAGDCTGAPFQVAKAVGEGLIAGQEAMNK